VKFRGRNTCIFMVAVATILALSNHTPLFALLYRFAPGFDHFRSHSKFLVQATPFVAVLTGQGMNQVLRSPRGAKFGAMLVLAAALIVGMVGFALWYFPGFPPIKNGWEQLMAAMVATGESYVPSRNYVDPDFIATAASFAGSRCLVSAGILLAIALLLYVRSFQEKAALALAILGIGEMFLFANSSIMTFSLSDTVPTMVRDFLSARPGDYRILELPDPPNSNGAIAIGAKDIWGYDPMVLGRYAQFVTYSQGRNPDDADMYVNFSRTSRLLGLVRLKYIFRNQIPISDLKGALPHLLLVGEWARQPDRHQILDSLDSSEFDPERTAILEADPDPAPVSAEGSPGTAQVVRSDTDSMTISARVTRPSLLLITDCYSRYWRAVAEPGSVQKHYAVVPADYTLMAVALSAGEHLIRLEYAPPGFIMGRWISLAGLGLYVFAAVFLWKRSRTHKLAANSEEPDPRNLGAG